MSTVQAVFDLDPKAQRFAQSVHLATPGYRPSDDYCHLVAPGAPRAAAGAAARRRSAARQGARAQHGRSRRHRPLLLAAPAAAGCYLHIGFTHHAGAWLLYRGQRVKD